MNQITLVDVEHAIRSFAETALHNEGYFSELDSAAGDGDFGASLASGFRVVLDEWEQFDRSSIGAFLLKVSMTISRHVGGCSGPIWGTGFMRAGTLTRDKTEISLEDLEKMLTAGIEGIQQRGGAAPGDKTLLDALLPVRDKVAEYAGRPDAEPSEVLGEAARVANEAIENTKDWVARRGRQSFTGERSKGTPDPGVVAVATMLNDLCSKTGADSKAAVQS